MLAPGGIDHGPIGLLGKCGGPVAADLGDDMASEERRRLAAERSRLFDDAAERYDRFRPSYPDAVIDAVLGPDPAALAVLDVGCGTGIASRLMVQRGAHVLGVEMAPRMAEIAHRQHGIEVEVAAFEDWEPAGRTFDRVTSAQAWHWLDLPVATAKAASLLRPDGRLCLFWSSGVPSDDLAATLAEVYASVLPSDVHTIFQGYAASTPEERRTGLDAELTAIAAEPELDAPSVGYFPWTRTFGRDEWLGQLLSRSDHTALDAAVQERLYRGIGAAIDDHGGSFAMSFETVLITAVRRST
jgi:SAM-dependent methyltransferase